GRPPYDADTASTVALKQLMSQPVSLQAFAPDVSSETAYVINRMLAKNPDERYASYSELVQHLSYARTKLLERSQQPRKAKERVVIETQAAKNISGLLSLALLSTFLTACVLTYVFRETIFGPSRSGPASAAYSNAQLHEAFRNAIQLLATHQAGAALVELDRLVSLSEGKQPITNWIRMSGGLAALAAGDDQDAARRFEALTKDDIYSTAEKDRLLASFFVEASKQLAKPNKPIPASITRLYSNTNFEAFGLLCFALHDWQIGDAENAGAILTSFLAAELPEPDNWIAELKPMARDYSHDCDLVGDIEKALSTVADAASAQSLLEKIRTTRAALKIGRRMAERLDSLERQLVAKSASP
ncbi:MAG TPA: hypothetical protein VIT18_02540, partial [Terrimicrobiaceae bacterium]